MEYFFTYVLNTKNILKVIVLLNLAFILRLIWSAILGAHVTSSQTDACAVAVIVILLCTVYRWVVLDVD